MNAGEEGTPILLGDAAFKERKEVIGREIMHSPDKIKSNFTLMCFSFSLNHACVVACLAYSSSELGDELGSVCNGILFVVFAMMAFLMSNPVVSAIGAKRGMVLGVIGYFLYVAGFLLSVLLVNSWYDFAWLIACFSAGIGGVAGGLMWTSQGRMFTRHATLYAQSTGLPIDNVNSSFAAEFATYFLGLEMTAKFLATIVMLMSESAGPSVIFIIYAILALLSCFVASTLHDMEDLGSGVFDYKTCSHNAGAAGRLIYKDQRLLLIIPFQIAYGFGSSMITFYVTGTVISDGTNLGSQYVGLLSAMIVLAGALFSIPSAGMTAKVGKVIMMTIGSACFLLSGLGIVLFSDESLAHWATIIPYLLIFGIGRGIWENTNKAIVSDFFSESAADSTTAFSTTAFFTGYASAVGYFTFFHISRLHMANFVIVTSIVSLVAYPIAFVVNREMKRQKNLAAHRQEIIRERFEECLNQRGRVRTPSVTRKDSLIDDTVL